MQRKKKFVQLNADGLALICIYIQLESIIIFYLKNHNNIFFWSSLAPVLKSASYHPYAPGN